MHRAIATSLGLVFALGGFAPAHAADVAIARIECGTMGAPTPVNPRFSDIFAFPDLKLPFVYSCYLIKHDNDYMLWDTGHAMTTPNVAPKESIAEQIAKVGLKPENIKFVGISHFHADHTGQVATFTKSTLLIGAKEWEWITAPKPAPGVNHAPFEAWKKGEAKVEPLDLDKDVFDDGTVMTLRTPGHTPGHQSLLVRLASGTFIISGDAMHFQENYQTLGVPAFNYDRAQTLASMERLKQLAANTKATIIIQHDARDVSKLAAIGAWTK